LVVIPLVSDVAHLLAFAPELAHGFVLAGRSPCPDHVQEVRFSAAYFLCSPSLSIHAIDSFAVDKRQRFLLFKSFQNTQKQRKVDK